jgi:ankyrin repeat protein
VSDDAFQTLMVDLCEAIERGNIQPILRQIDSGIVTNLTGRNGDTILHVLCEEEIEDSLDAAAVVRALVAHGASITAKSPDSWTPLHLAANRGKPLVFKALIERAVPDFDIVRDGGYSVLHSAILGGSSEICKAVVDGGANVNLYTKDEGSPLHMACRYADADVIKILIDAGSDLNAACDDYAMPPMQGAHTDDVFFCMLEAGADPHLRPAGCGTDYLTPFEQAVLSGYAKSIRACLSLRSTNVERKTLAGMSVLELAEEGG